MNRFYNLLIFKSFDECEFLEAREAAVPVTYNFILLNLFPLLWLRRQSYIAFILWWVGFHL